MILLLRFMLAAAVFVMILLPFYAWWCPEQLLLRCVGSSFVMVD